MDSLGEALGSCLSALIFIPIGAVLHSVTQSVATGLIEVHFVLLNMVYLETL
jgi:hypothetical protein